MLVPRQAIRLRGIWHDGPRLSCKETALHPSPTFFSFVLDFSPSVKAVWLGTPAVGLEQRPLSTFPLSCCLMMEGAEEDMVFSKFVLLETDRSLFTIRVMVRSSYSCHTLGCALCLLFDIPTHVPNRPHYF